MGNLPFVRETLHRTWKYNQGSFADRQARGKPLLSRSGGWWLLRGVLFTQGTKRVLTVVVERKVNPPSSPYSRPSPAVRPGGTPDCRRFYLRGTAVDLECCGQGGHEVASRRRWPAERDRAEQRGQELDGARQSATAASTGGLRKKVGHLWDLCFPFLSFLRRDCSVSRSRAVSGFVLSRVCSEPILSYCCV